MGAAILEREPSVWQVQLQRNDGEVIDDYPFSAYWSPPDDASDFYASRGFCTPQSIADAAACEATRATKPNPNSGESKPRYSFKGLSAILTGGPVFARRYGDLPAALEDSDAGDGDTASAPAEAAPAEAEDKSKRGPREADAEDKAERGPREK